MSLRVVNSRINIPIDLIPTVTTIKEVNRLKVFVAGKMVSPGFISDAQGIQNICSLLEFSHRTVMTHMADLVRIGWVGHSPGTTTYYFRSWAWFYEKGMIYNRDAATADVRALNHFQSFLLSAKLALRIRKQELFERLNRDKSLPRKTVGVKSRKSAITKRGIASQDQLDTPRSNSGKNKLPYHGLSIQAMAQMLNLSPARACALKKEAVAAGYFRTNKKYNVISSHPTPIPNLRNLYLKAFPDKKNIRVMRDYTSTEPSILLVEQLHDEIIPVIPLKSVKYFKLYQKSVLRTISPFTFRRNFRMSSKVLMFEVG